MNKSAAQRGIFLVFCIIWAFVAPTIQPRVYGNDEASIKRYLYQEVGRQLEDHIELLAVEDVNEDRIAIFRRENKAPEEVYYVLFEQNETGNYEGGHPMMMLCVSRGGGIYSAWMTNTRWEGEESVRYHYYTIWSEHSELDTITFQWNDEEPQTFKVDESPSMTVIERVEYNSEDGHNRVITEYYDAAGNPLH